MKKENKITVIVMTYNQKDYIKAALESILRQKIDVGFHVLVHDDCSTDGTYEIVKKFEEDNPGILSVIHQSERRYLKDGFNMMIYKYVVPCISTEYVAYCDGDDYWIDNYKLQKQFSFLENNPEYSMCFHSSYQLKNKNDFSSKWYIGNDDDISMDFIVNERPGIRIATSSVFLRKTSFVDFPDWRKKYPVEDVPMYMTAALHGKIHRIKDVMSVYRQFSVGSWSSQKDNAENMNKHYLSTIKAIELFDEQTNYSYHNLVIKKIDGCEFRMALLNRNYRILLARRYRYIFKNFTFKKRFAIRLQYRLPCLYNLFHKKKKA